jgi:hypothetical protein
MRGLAQHIRARGIPAALLTAAAAIWGLWALWTAISRPSTVPAPMAMAATGLAAIAAGTTLTGPDTDLDSTAALPWPPYRALHLTFAGLVILGLLLSVAGTAHEYGHATGLVRNCAGALGLVSLGAATLGGARSWFYLVPWITIPPMLPTTTDSIISQVLRWPLQPTASTAATATAVILLALGATSYILRGSRATMSARSSTQRAARSGT